MNRRVTALFKGMSSDFLLREQFVTDPAQVLAEFVGGKSLHDDVASGANHLLYAVLSNPRLLAWVRAYAEQTEGKPPSGEAFAREFSRALAADGDEATMLALISGAGTSHDLFAAQSDLLRAFITALGSGRGGVVASGTEFTPGTSGTNVSPGTNITPGHLAEKGGVFSNPGKLAGGTEFTPGTSGTNVSPGTNITPGHAIEKGGVFSNPAGNVASGTLSTPGTGGTLVSPGTMISQGQLKGLNVVEAQVTLQAVVSFAQQLRRSGALNTTRFG